MDELVRDTLESIAVPRMTGTQGALDVEAQLRGRLLALGYDVRELRFRFSTVPGRYGVPIVGALYLVFTLGAISLLHRNSGPAALIALSVLLALVTLFAATHEKLIRRLRWGGADGINLLVHRKGARPRYIICAHRDSKSQPLPTYGRVIAVALALGAWAVLFLLALLNTVWPSLPLGIVPLILGVPTVIAGFLLLTCWSANDSPGALDNASGLAALMGIATNELASDDVAFLLTDAEELGLAGAAAVARQLPPVAGIINIDGLDDDGPFHIVERFGWPHPHGIAPHLAAALMTAAQDKGLEAIRRDLPLGMLTDHVRFAQARFPSVTLMRGTRSSLMRVHRPSDDLAHLKGQGAVAAIDLVSGALALLRARAVAA
jgi:hypothetical protein